MITMSASKHRSASVARDIMADKQQSDVSALSMLVLRYVHRLSLLNIVVFHKM